MFSLTDEFFFLVFLRSWLFVLVWLLMMLGSFDRFITRISVFLVILLNGLLFALPVHFFLKLKQRDTTPVGFVLHVCQV